MTARYNIRAKVEPGAWSQLQIEYDSSGVWIPCGTMNGVEGLPKTYMLPVRPRRCDHYRIRFVGKGEVEIYSIFRKLADGGDGQNGFR